MKHTKGPWEISKIGNNYDQYSVYSEGSSSGNIVNTVEGEANARLISAAPDMLEALAAYDQIVRITIKRLIRQYGKQKNDYATELTECLAMACDAISKARGL